MKTSLPCVLAILSLFSSISCDQPEDDTTKKEEVPVIVASYQKRDALPAEKVARQPDLALAGTNQSTSMSEEDETIDYGDFYEALGPLGQWHETEEYGSVWQPFESEEEDWSPYTKGQWVYSDQGWNWVSSEPFGWATYHYGRWGKLRKEGWVWVPGTEWAPSWVSWRSSYSYIGWAPLPPETLAHPQCEWDSSVESRYGINSSCYTFINTRYFDRHIPSYCLPVSYNPTCFRVSSNITRFRYTNDRIYCGGPIYQDLSSRLGRRLPFCRLNFVTTIPRQPRSGWIRNKVEGERLIMHAPKIRSTGTIPRRSQETAMQVERPKKIETRVVDIPRQAVRRQATTVRSRALAQDSQRSSSPQRVIPTVRRSGEIGSRPSVVAQRIPSREKAKAPSEERAKGEEARKVQSEIARHSDQDRIAQKRARYLQATASLREEEKRRHAEAVRRKQREVVQRQQIDAQRRQRELVSQQREQQEREELAAQQKAAKEVRQAQEEEAREQGIIDQKRQREVAQRRQIEDQQRQRMQAEQAQRDESRRRQQEAEEQSRRADAQRRQREADERRRQEVARQRQAAEEQQQRLEAQRRAREAAQQRQRVEEQRRARESAQRRQREETQRQQRQAGESRRRSK